jgi:uncharacterized protein (DUF2147 family)
MREKRAGFNARCERRRRAGTSVLPAHRDVALLRGLARIGAASAIACSSAPPQGGAMKTLPALAAALAGTIALAAPAQAAQPINGRYVTEDGAALVEVGPCGGKTCGRIVRVLKHAPGAAATDVNNKDKALRSRPIVGMPVLSEFADAGSDWRGRIYDPRNGKTYKSIVSRNTDGTLKVQGCIAFLCQTQVWRPAR